MVYQILIEFSKISIAHFIYDDILGDGKSILFGVCDGHGGFDVAEYVIKNFKKVNSNLSKKKIEQMILGIFESIYSLQKGYQNSS